jgi:predicted dehydrogenase
LSALRVGVIGLGVGERHLVAYQEAGCEVVAVCDIDPKHLAEVGARYDIGRLEQDYHKLTEAPDIDALSICSYDDAHVEQAVSALRNGKHVFLEKPLALRREDAETLLRAYQESGCRISSNLILRQSPRFIEIQQRVRSGELGEIFHVEADYVHQILWKLTEGWRGKMDFYCVVYGGGIHSIDLMRWVIGKEITEVSGMSSKILTRDTAYRFDDTFVNLFHFEGGATGKVLTTLGPQRTKFHALTVYGTEGTFVNDRPHAKFFDGDEPENEHQVTTPYPGMEKGDLLADFIEAIREGREPAVSARDMFRVMDVCFAAWESVQQHRTLPVSYMI